MCESLRVFADGLGFCDEISGAVGRGDDGTEGPGRGRREATWRRWGGSSATVLFVVDGGRRRRRMSMMGRMVFASH